MREPVFVTDISGKSVLARSSAAASLAVHAAAILAAILVGAPVSHFIAQPRSLVLIAPGPTPVPRVLPIPPRASRQAVPPPQTPKLTLPVIEIPAAEIPAAEIPAAEIPPAPVVEPMRAVLPTPELPRLIVPLTPPVKTGEFAQALPETPKTAPHLSLQASGFASAENSRSPVPRGPLKAALSGFDNAGATSQGPRRTGVSASGFSDAAPAAVPPAARQPIATTSFGDAATERPPSVTQAPVAVSLTSPVDIVSKPRPVYTAEARSLGLEGEVLVEVVFEAGGGVRVVRLVKGLGHGLDENAVAAAREIRFRPARRGGVAADASAVVHILFQLAY